MGYHAVANRDEDETAWLAARRALVTSSDAPHLICRDWRFALSPEELARRKLPGGEIEENHHMAAGSYWEQRIIDFLSPAAGLVIASDSSLYRSDRWPHMGASPDGNVMGCRVSNPSLSPWVTVIMDYEIRLGVPGIQALHGLIEDHGGHALVEIKNKPSKARSQWNKPKGPPPEVLAQAQHELAVCDLYTLNLVVAKVDHNELYIHPVVADPLYHELLSELALDFYETHLTPLK